ncbi:unnamed protein product [Cylindrotheca closterium]|uniref:PX domain-containing protein n=1 Tax=Cylindrotheca closterium TaxID=2856 RepID=A0AAD2FXB9_9STRA|nr:unnamed protein product [Cylindrotheca closterium]
MDKNSLLASLTGEADFNGEKTEQEHDLFGDIPVEDDQDAALAPPFAVGGQQPPPNGASLPPLTSPPGAVPSPVVNGGSMSKNGMAPVAPQPPPAAPAPAPSLLAQSGLLGIADSSDGDGGGLFDAVDEEQAQKEAEELRIREEAEQKRLEQQREEEERQKQIQLQKEEEERRRREQEEQLRQQQQKQQQQQMQMKQQQQQQRQMQLQQQQQMSASYATQNHPMGQYQQPPMQQQPPQQQQSAMMQSTVIPPQQQQPQQLNSQIQSMTLNAQTPQDDGGFYRDHASPMAGSMVNGGPPSNVAVGAAVPTLQVNQGQPQGNNYYYGTQQQPQQQQQQQQQMAQSQLGITTAGMHNAMPGAGQVRKMVLSKPDDVTSLYTKIVVSEPMLIQTQNFLLSSPPYWSYQVTSSLSNNQGTWLVRRRFRHIVALEDRLRQSCLGCILPPRPEKHATRALEEATTQQSAEFAMQRANEMESYLNSLAVHPVAGQSQELRLFLGLQDDIGTAWSEVSNNAFTRLGAMGAGMSMKVADTTSASINAHEWEDNAELLGMCSSENLRMGAVVTAVPKLEGTAAILREQGDASGAVGMELSKVPKISDDLKMCDVLSNGLLRNGRRTKRLALELSAALEPFMEQYKTVRYERWAMQDRKTALQRRSKERGRADSRAMYLAQQQRQLQASGQFGHLSHLEQSAVQGDQFALGAVGEADEIGARLKSEINRIAVQRRIQWNASIKSIASSMKEASSERHAIWQSTLEAFQESFPSS